jgi:hypothetical protein
MMSSSYTYSLEQCDVRDKRRLEQYRAKRVVWLSWLETDEHHAIWSTIQSLVWTDVAFRCLTGFTTDRAPTSLENTLLAEALINGYVATQILAIRRLIDRGSDVISLPRLVKDIKSHASLLTREHYVCHDGLPYDWERVQREEMSTQVGRAGRGIWVSTTGPAAWGTSQMAHDQFDKLSKVSSNQRQRDDLIEASILQKVESWLNTSGAVELGKWSSVYLAHAGGTNAREALSTFRVTADRISDAIRNLARVAEAIGAYVLWSSGRLNALMTTPQFDPFEGLELGVMAASQQSAAHTLWDKLSHERDTCLASVAEDLFG